MPRDNAKTLGAKVAATVPTRKWPTCNIQRACHSNEAAVDGDNVAMSTQYVSAQCGNRLDDEDRGWNVSAEVRERSEGLRQSHDCQ